MTKTVIRRLLIFIPQLILLSIGVFILQEIMPGDAVNQLIGQDMTPEEIHALRVLHGVYDPWYVNYWRWAVGVFTQWDFGRSFVNNLPVTDLIAQRAINTIRLSFLSTIITIGLSLPLGIIAAKRAGKWQDKAILNFGFATQAMPALAMSILAIWIFALILGWFPMSGSADVLVNPNDSWAMFWSRLHHLILPSFVAGILGNFAMIFTLRAVIIDNTSAAFVTTAKSKGVPSNVIYRKHIMRNSLLPFAGTIPMLILGLLTGSIFVERIFMFPGMGDLFISSILARDFPVVTALVMMYGIISLVGVLLADILMTIIDPRIRIK